MSDLQHYMESTSRLREENDELRSIIAAYDSPGALGEVFSVFGQISRKQKERIEDAEAERDRLIEALRTINFLDPAGRKRGSPGRIAREALASLEDR